MHAIQTANTTVGFEGWIQINFTSMVSEWLAKKWSNNVLYITIEYGGENDVQQIHASNVCVNYLLSYSDSEHQPFITAYFENNDTDGHVMKHETVRNISTTVRRASFNLFSTFIFFLYFPFLTVN